MRARCELQAARTDVKYPVSTRRINLSMILRSCWYANSEPIGIRREVLEAAGDTCAAGGRTHHPAYDGGYFAALLLIHQPRSCRHSTDPDDSAKQENPWTLAQIADPRAETYVCNFSLRQLAVVADGLTRRPCSFASPPFGGFAFSWSLSLGSECVVRPL